MTSVIVPSFNRQDYVVQTVESVLGQSYPYFEIIVVDDGSTDGTAARLDAFRELPNFFYVYQENQGRSAARNHGIRVARGHYLMFLDSDDLLAPGALEHLHEGAARDPAAGLVVGLVELIDGKGEPLCLEGNLGTRPSGRKRRHRLALLEIVAHRAVRNWQFEHDQIPRPPRFAYPVLMEREHFFLGATLVSRRLVEHIGGFDPELEPCEDTDFQMRAALDSEVAYVDALVTRYRRHDSNTPSHRFKLGGKRLYKKHLRILGKREDLPKDVRRRLKSLCLIYIGNRCYALDQSLTALYYYFMGITTCPSSLVRTGVALQCLKSLIPAPLRRWVRGTI